MIVFHFIMTLKNTNITSTVKKYKNNKLINLAKKLLMNSAPFTDKKLLFGFIGTLVWKITDYSNKLADARSKEGMELVSPPWYTSQFGYKLQASLFLNGNGAGENTHLSLYIKILPGEYDALLRWPFAHSVAFTLFDQSEKVSY